MDRRRAAGALLALAVCIAGSEAAPTASNQTALDLYEGTSEGCYYNFQHYGEGDRIMTNEPCLNCTCHNRMLMCYLRVCPFTKPIGQDCTVEKRADQCCPIVTCPDVPVDLLTSTSTTSPAEYGSTGLGRLDKYGCSINNKYFPEGSKVPSTPNKPCEHCYCIRNMTTCVMQECTLHVDGCTPIYHKDVCCPVRYSCDHPEDEVLLLDDMTTTVRPTPGFLLTTTTASPVTQMSQDCVHDDQIVSDGALIKTEKACEHCYCMKGDIVCVVQECGTPMENEGKNCTSQPPREGQCCPDTYICEGDEPSTDLPSEITTRLFEMEESTTGPPRRVGIEGSGYRNEPDEPYTEISPLETETEGSGYEHITEPSIQIDESDTIEKQTTEATSEPTKDSVSYTSTANTPTLEEVEKTTEPDKGLNTVPSDIFNEEHSETNIYHKTTFEEPTEPSKIGDNLNQNSETTSNVASEVTQPFSSTTDIEIQSTTEFIPTTDESINVVTEKSEQTEPEKSSTSSIEEDLLEDKYDIPSTKLPIIDENEILTTAVPAEVTKSDKDTTQGQKLTTEPSLLASTSEDIFKPSDVVTELSSKIEDITPTEITNIPETTSIDNKENEVEDFARIPGEGDCLSNGVTYRNMSEVPSTNNCQTSCRCVSSIVKCDPIICSRPPEYMDNCQPTYDTPDSCCPTYVCHTGETMPPQPDSHMSETEKPIIPSTIECHGEQCETKTDVESPASSEKPSISDCGSASCGEDQHKPSDVPLTDRNQIDCDGSNCAPPVASCDDGGCQATPQETQCQGDICGTEPEIKPVKDIPLCLDKEGCQPAASECVGDTCTKVDCIGDDCSTAGVPLPPQTEVLCNEKDGCKTPEDDTALACVGESCRRKENGEVDKKPSLECKDSLCLAEPPADKTTAEQTESSLDDATTKPDDSVTKETQQYDKTTVIQELYTNLPQYPTTEKAEESDQNVTEQEVDNVVHELSTPDLGVDTEEQTKSPELTEKTESIVNDFAVDHTENILETSQSTEPTQVSVTQPTTQENTIIMKDYDNEITQSPEVSKETIDESTTEQEQESTTANKPSADEIVSTGLLVKGEDQPEEHQPMVTDHIETTTKLDIAADITERQDETTSITKHTDIYDETKTTLPDQSSSENIENANTTPISIDQKIENTDKEIGNENYTSGTMQPTEGDIHEIVTKIPDREHETVTVTDMLVEHNTESKVMEEIPALSITTSSSDSTDQSTTVVYIKPETTTIVATSEKADSDSQEIPDKEIQPEITVPSDTLEDNTDTPKDTTDSTIQETTKYYDIGLYESQGKRTDKPNTVYTTTDEDMKEDQELFTSAPTTSSSEEATSNKDSEQFIDEITTLPEEETVTSVTETLTTDKIYKDESKMPELFTTSSESSSVTNADFMAPITQETDTSDLDFSVQDAYTTPVSEKETYVTSFDDTATHTTASLSIDEKLSESSTTNLPEKDENLSVTDKENEVSTIEMTEVPDKIDQNEEAGEVSDVPSDTAIETIASTTAEIISETTSSISEDTESHTQVPHSVDTPVNEIVTESTVASTEESAVTKGTLNTEYDAETEQSKLSTMSVEEITTEKPEKIAEESITTEIPVGSEKSTLEPQENQSSRVTESNTQDDALSVNTESYTKPTILDTTDIDDKDHYNDIAVSIPAQTDKPDLAEATPKVIDETTIYTPESSSTQTLETQTSTATEIVTTSDSVMEIAPDSNLEDNKVPIEKPEQTIIKEEENVTNEPSLPKVTLSEETTKTNIEQEDISTDVPVVVTEEYNIETDATSAPEIVPKIKDENIDEQKQTIIDLGTTPQTSTDEPSTFTHYIPEQQDSSTDSPESHIKEKEITEVPDSVSSGPQDIATSSPIDEYTPSQVLDEKKKPEDQNIPVIISTQKADEIDETTTTKATADEITTSPLDLTTAPESTTKFFQEQTTVITDDTTTYKKTENEDDIQMTKSPIIDLEAETGAAISEISTQKPKDFVPQEQDESPASSIESTTEPVSDTETYTVSDQKLPKDEETEVTTKSSNEIATDAPTSVSDSDVVVTSEVPTTEDVIDTATEQEVQSVTTKMAEVEDSSKESNTGIYDDITTEPMDLNEIKETSPRAPESEDQTPQSELTTVKTETETTPYVVELEEHTHKPVEETTVPEEQESTTTLIQDETPEKLNDVSEKPSEEFEEPSKEDREKQSTTTATIPEDDVARVTNAVEVTDITTPASKLSQENEASTEALETSTNIQTGEITTSAPQSENVENTTAKEVIPEIVVPVETEKTPTTINPLENKQPEEAVTTSEVSTTKKEEELTTPAVFTPEEVSKVETSTTVIPDVPKPGLNEVLSTDESPDDEHFPPSAGTSGYGQEPDYVEEDQAFGPGTCRYGGKVYVSAQQIPRDDPCDFCFCFRSDIICLQQSCPPPIHGCHEEPIQGFCCPRYECPVAMATTLNVTTTTTTTTTTLPPHFNPHAYKGAAQRRGCQIKGHTYKVGEVVRASSGPCLHCTCGGDGQMKCDPKACTPEPMLRQMIAAAVSAKRRR